MSHKNPFRQLVESIQEIYTIIKTCLTTIWFWLPILYACLSLFHLWMIFYVHPLTIFILPGIIVVYSIYLDEKRAKAGYERTNSTTSYQ